MMVYGVIIIVCYILIIFLSLGIFTCISSYKTHVKMNKDEKLPYDYVDFTTFLNEFNKYKDNPNMKYKTESIFLRDENYDPIVYLHADIVRFGDKCMIFKPLSWFRYCRWIKKQCKNKNRVKGLWDNKLD